MAEKIQINPRITVELKGLLEQEAKARGCALSDIVETALRAFLQPQDVGTIQELVLAKVTAIEGLLRGGGGVSGAGGAAVAADTLPPVATYEQLYGPMEAEETWPPPAAAPPPTRGWLSRLFFREVW